jgi:hypothetical protein
VTTVENLRIPGSTRSQEEQASRNAAAIDQDWSDARASVNRRLQLEDLYEIMDAICDQLLGARRIGADAAELGAVLLAGIETFLNEKADWAVPNAPCRQAERSDPVLVSLLQASVERARQ